MDPFTTVSLVEPILLIIFAVTLIIFGYFSITLVHHWNYYSFNIQIKRILKGIYFFVSILIILALFLLIGLYILGYGI